MKRQKLVIGEDLKVKLDELRKTLAGISLQGGNLIEISNPNHCGENCMITCSWYCETTCAGSCRFEGEMGCAYKAVCPAAPMLPV